MGGKHGGAQIHDTSEHSSTKASSDGAKVMASACCVPASLRDSCARMGRSKQERHALTRRAVQRKGLAWEPDGFLGPWRGLFTGT